MRRHYVIEAWRQSAQLSALRRGHFSHRAGVDPDALIASWLLHGSKTGALAGRACALGRSGASSSYTVYHGAWLSLDWNAAYGSLPLMSRRHRDLSFWRVDDPTPRTCRKTKGPAGAAPSLHQTGLFRGLSANALATGARLVDAATIHPRARRTRG